MRLLLDTHIFLWYISGDPKLPAGWYEIFEDEINEVFLSVVSIWEATVKYDLGKLPLPGPTATYLVEQRASHQLTPLPLSETSIAHLAGLPSLHRDPFDRILIAQALDHNLIVATVDGAFLAYPVRVLPR